MAGSKVAPIVQLQVHEVVSTFIALDDDLLQSFVVWQSPAAT